LRKKQNIDLILIDLNLPKLGGIDLLQVLLEQGITIPAVCISGDSDPAKIKQALDLGACGFIPKSYASDKFITALKHVIDGGIFITEDIQYQIKSLDRAAVQKRKSNSSTTPIKITPRQFQVLKLMRKGHSNKQISNELNVSIDTVKEHVRNVFILFDVNNRVSCLYRAEELGFDLLPLGNQSILVAPYRIFPITALFCHLFYVLFVHLYSQTRLLQRFDEAIGDFKILFIHDIVQ